MVEYHNGNMKKVAIGFAIGLIVGVASTIIGLELLANDPLLASQGITASIPDVWNILFLALKGFLIIFAGAFTLGVLISAINYVLIEIGRRKKG